jgi:hypothetical protein
MTPLSKKSRPARPSPNMERDAIWFTVGLYLSICAGLLGVHYSNRNIRRVHPLAPSFTKSGSSGDRR